MGNVCVYIYVLLILRPLRISKKKGNVVERGEKMGTDVCVPDNITVKLNKCKHSEV